MQTYRATPEGLEKCRQANRNYAAKNREAARVSANSYYALNKEAVKAKQIAKRKNAKSLYVAWLGSKCMECGFANIAALQFHHKDSSTKLFAISDAINYPSRYTIEQVETEVKKCDLLCANCHSIQHFYR